MGREACASPAGCYIRLHCWIFTTSFNHCGRGWNLVMPKFGDSRPVQLRKHTSVNARVCRSRWVSLNRWKDFLVSVADKPKRNYPTHDYPFQPLCGQAFRFTPCLCITRSTDRLWSPLECTSLVRRNIYRDTVFSLLGSRAEIRLPDQQNR